MNIKRYFWAWFLALVIGFGIGLFYAWVISPIKYVDAEPNTLRNDFKDQFRSVIAAAYASNADLERARARLALLGDTEPSQNLIALAQRMVASGEPPDTVQQVTLLASALQRQKAELSETNTPKSTSNIITATRPAERIITETRTTKPSVIESTNTPLPIQTVTPRPTRTSTPTLGAPYELIGQDTLCDTELADGLLQVVVSNIIRKQIPGAEIIITWNGGEEHIFTGMKPELGNGYADFIMSPDVVYSVRMANGGTSASEVSAPECTSTDGELYQGGVYITYQQP